MDRDEQRDGKREARMLSGVNAICLINDLDEDGGAQRVVRDLASSYPTGKMTVITLRPPRGPAGNPPFPHLSLTPVRPRTIARAVGLIVRSDVLHVHLFPSLYLAAAVPKPKLFTEHNTWNRRREKRLFRWLDRIVYTRYNYVACISDATADALSDWLAPHSPPIGVIENGVDLRKFARKPRTKPSDSRRLLMVGRFTDQKDQDTIIRALAEMPDGFHLTLVGDGPHRLRSENLASELGIANRVTFTGRVLADEVAALYDSSDLYVQSSNWEGFGLVVVEAMAAGLPVIATAVPGLAQVVGSTSQLFPVGDFATLATKAVSLLTDPLEYAKLSAASVERSLGYSRDRMVESYQESYEWVLADGDSSTRHRGRNPK